jgi:hypothetical protein
LYKNGKYCDGEIFSQIRNVMISIIDLKWVRLNCMVELDLDGHFFNEI